MPNERPVTRQKRPRKSRRRRSPAIALPLPTDRLWHIEEAAHFFGMGPGWVRQHIPAICLPSAGARGAIRFSPQTCHALAEQFQRSNRGLVSIINMENTK